MASSRRPEKSTEEWTICDKKAFSPSCTIKTYYSRLKQQSAKWECTRETTTVKKGEYLLLCNHIIMHIFKQPFVGDFRFETRLLLPFFHSTFYSLCFHHSWFFRCLLRCDTMRSDSGNANIFAQKYTAFARVLLKWVAENGSCVK